MRNASDEVLALQLMLTDARIQPQEPLPAEAFVELLQIGALAGAERSQWRAHDAEQCNSTAARLTRALLRDAVDGARLLVNLQARAVELECD